MRSIDLHGLPPDQALRKLSQGLHAARLERAQSALVITGRGLGNKSGQPVLRGYVEDWLRGPEGRRHGVQDFHRVHRGGALELELG